MSQRRANGQYQREIDIESLSPAAKMVHQVLEEAFEKIRENLAIINGDSSTNSTNSSTNSTIRQQIDEALQQYFGKSGSKACATILRGPSTYNAFCSDNYSRVAEQVQEQPEEQPDYAGSLLSFVI